MWTVDLGKEALTVSDWIVWIKNTCVLQDYTERTLATATQTVHKVVSKLFLKKVLYLNCFQ